MFASPQGCETLDSERSKCVEGVYKHVPFILLPFRPEHIYLSKYVEGGGGEFRNQGMIVGMILWVWLSPSLTLTLRAE